MLTEDDVIRHLCTHFESAGYTILSSCSTTKRGVDFVAQRLSDGRHLRVEAKGGTSSKAYTNRYGKPFNAGQILSHVSRAFYAAAALRGAHPDGEAAIALPDDRGHVDCVGKIAAACRDLGIGVFMVDAMGSVRRLT